jgi:hypothetical protein
VEHPTINGIQCVGASGVQFPNEDFLAFEMQRIFKTLPGSLSIAL